MLLIDTYLQKNNLKRYDVSKLTGISQQVLSNSRNKSALELPVKVVNAIAQSVNKTPGFVLDELIALENEDSTFVAKDWERFRIGLENQQSLIVVKGDLIPEVQTLLKQQLSNNEKEVFEIGFRNLYTFVNLAGALKAKLTGKYDEYKIEEMLSNYNILVNARDEIILQDRRSQF